jgi:hypothetical protein
MQWTRLGFGKHIGRTLPQVLMSDPDWLFWAVRNNIFAGRHALEAEKLMARATAIKPPFKKAKEWEVECRFERDGRFHGFDFVEATQRPEYSSFVIVREPYLDLSLLARRKGYDKGGYRRLMDKFRCAYFGENSRISKRRCERFFSDRRNFGRLVERQ